MRLIRRRSRNRESQRRSTVAPFMQLAVSASSAVPAAPPLQQRSPSEAVRLPSTRTTQLALLQSAPSTVICLRSACCLKLLLRCMRIHSSDAAIRAARLSPRLQAAQHLLKRQSLPSSRLLCLPLSGAANLPTVPERPLLASPAVGPLPSELALPALQRLRLRLTPAQTVPICLWCPTSRASTRLSSGHSPPSAMECAACTLRRSNCHCHFSSPKSLPLTGSHGLLLEDSKLPTLFQIDHSNLPQCPGRPKAGS